MPDSRWLKYRRRVAELEAENEELRAQLKAARAHKKRPPAAPTAEKTEKAEEAG